MTVPEAIVICFALLCGAAISIAIILAPRQGTDNLLSHSTDGLWTTRTITYKDKEKQIDC